jgi:hypothetical protein
MRPGVWALYRDFPSGTIPYRDIALHNEGASV